MLIGLNHITLTVSNLHTSVEFYCSLLELELKAKWDSGAYLRLENLWLCLLLGDVKPAKDYTHFAFSIARSDFESFVEKLRTHQVGFWKDNVSEGNSIYFLDPDGHKLEAHVGDLQSRLKFIKRQPYKGLEIF